jgi:hypothetical protein
LAYFAWLEKFIMPLDFTLSQNLMRRQSPSDSYP